MIVILHLATEWIVVQFIDLFKKMMQEDNQIVS